MMRSRVSIFGTMSPMKVGVIRLMFPLLGLIACSSELDTRVIVSAECARAPGATLHWAVTAGECGIRPGAVEFAGVVSEEEPSFVLGAGEYCVWALAVDESCRVLAATSTGRTLPEGRGAVTLTLDESTCIEDDRNAWDLLVEASAGCAPSCEPDRCDCSRASACSGDEAYCPAPLRGDLLDSSLTHTCVGRQRASGIHCWSTGLPILLPTPTAIFELSVGPDFVCYLGPEDGEMRNTIYCSQVSGGDFGPWQAVDRSSSCIDGISAPIPHDIAVGDGFVCAIVDLSERTGIACWGNPPTGTLPGSARRNCATEAEDVVPGPVLFIADSGVRWDTITAGADVLCAIRNQANVDCIGDDAPDGQALVPEGQGVTAIEMSGDLLCVALTNGRAACSDPAFASGSRWADFGISSSEEAMTFCGVRPEVSMECIGTGRIDVDFAKFSVAPGAVCGITPEFGRVSCVTVAGEPARGTVAATPGTSWVCPDE
ncbi:MAG: hypothetical protein ACI9KE_005770 [Polyangiales bacterium]|jgi:hypothetical protein